MKQLHEIMNLIGRKRFIMLAMVLVMSAILGGVWQQVLLPKESSLRMEKSSIESERTRLQREMQELPVKYEELKANEARYEELLKGSFMSTQDRIEARARMDILRQQSGLRGLNYTIAPQESVNHPAAQNLGGTFTRSNIRVVVKAVSDLEVRDFIDRMYEGFGGLVLLKKLEMKQDMPVNQSNLQKLKNKTPVDFVSAVAEFHWHTIVPEAVSDEKQAGGL